ncbi:MAG: hypothetical protein GWO19_07095, partial [Nitrospinaceae bacterium]|nr:hypothetical protein [Nitrospinaceae bacterium]NIU95992.1 hypothetical protein [Nitrospinaceae bacterium]
IVISGGFAEMGRPGRALQDALKTEAKKHGVRVIGPNGMGVFSAPARFNSFFLLPEAITLPLPGPVALISQSGAFLSLLLDRFSDMGVGVQRAVNFGNRVDVEECELLEAYETDPDISVIGLYLESVVDGARFVEVARRVARTKPIVIWKGGQAGRAGDAARAHSASLTGSYEVFQAACAKAGLIEVQGFDEFLQALEVLALQPPARGDRVLIVSNGGGMGVFLTDLCEKAGLRIPEPSPAQQAQLKNFLPEYYSFKNPIDLTGSGTNEQCSQAVDLLLQSGEFDALLLVLLAGTTGITPEVTRPLRGRFSAPLPVVVGAYGRTLAPALRTEFLKDGVPVFFSAEAATRALKILVDQGRNLREVHRPASDWKPHYTPEGEAGWTQWVHDTPDEMQLKSHLRHCGVLVPASVHLKTRRDLEEAVRRLKFPMTLKAVGSEIQH